MKKRIIALSLLVIPLIISLIVVLTDKTTPRQVVEVEQVIIIDTPTIIIEKETQATEQEIGQEESKRITDASEVYTKEQVQEAQYYLDSLYVEIPDEIIQYCEEIGQLYHISPELLESMCWCETGCTYEIISDADAYGIMQVCPKWHKDRMERLGVTDLFDPYQCILTGADYLSELSETYEAPEAVTAYNQGYCNGVVNNYAQKVIKIAEALERVHNK